MDIVDALVLTVGFDASKSVKQYRALRNLANNVIAT